MKFQRGEQRYSSVLCLTSTLDRVCGQRHAPAALSLGNTRYPLYMRSDGPQGQSWRVRKISHQPGFDPQSIQPVASCYTGWDIPPHHSPTVRNHFIGKCHVIKISAKGKTCRNIQNNCNQGQVFPARVSLGRCCAQSRSEDELRSFHNSASCVTTTHPPTTFNWKWERKKFARIYTPFNTLQLCRVVTAGGCVIAEDIACRFVSIGALTCVSGCQQLIAMSNMDHKQAAEYFCS